MGIGNTKTLLITIGSVFVLTELIFFQLGSDPY